VFSGRVVWILKGDRASQWAEWRSRREMVAEKVSGMGCPIPRVVGVFCRTGILEKGRKDKNRPDSTSWA